MPLSHGHLKFKLGHDEFKLGHDEHLWPYIDYCNCLRMCYGPGSCGCC